MAPELTTERLRLRHWRAEDREPFAALNCDPKVMEYLPVPLTREQSDGMADRIDAFLRGNPYGLWAIEAEDVPFAGFVGLSEPRFEAHFMPCVEVGWRLARAAWGRGYATEAARAAVSHGLQVAGLDEIVSMTAVSNGRSRRVMERIGMTHSPDDDFDHPALPGHRLERHVLYRISSP